MINEDYRVADYIADFFFEKGVKNVYSLPGGGAMHLIDAFTKNKNISHIAFFHEQGASIAAEAASRTLENDIGVCCVTTGPGATNAVTAVAGAWIESSPLVIISGQVKRADMLGNKNLRQSGVQEVQITRVVDPITKYSRVVGSPEEIQEILQEAYDHATSGRKGPVWIDVPLDVQGAPFKKSKYSYSRSIEDVNNNWDLEKVVKLLLNAKKPVFFWGNGVKLDKSSEEVYRLIETYRLPSVFTWNASDILDYENKWNFGRPGVVAQRHANFIVQKSDLVIAVGTSLDNVLTAYSPEKFASNAKKVIINIDENQLINCSIPNSIMICDSAKSFIKKMNERLNKINCNLRIDNWIKECVHLKNQFQDDFPNEHEDDGKISHKDFVLELSSILEEGQLIATGSSGLAIEAFYMMFRNKKRQKYFLTSGLGSMGYGLPASIGIACENVGNTVILIESDGSLAMNIQELQTIINNNLPICIVLMNNNGYASIRNTQTNYFDNRFFGTGDEAGQAMPNWRKIAEAFEFFYDEIECIDNLKLALSRFKKNRKPSLINVILTSNEKLLPKCAAIPLKDGKIISMPLEDMTPLLPLTKLKEIMGNQINQLSISARSKQVN
jgi:acetolactate synthase I/II/III large subunit